MRAKIRKGYIFKNASASQPKVNRKANRHTAKQVGRIINYSESINFVRKMGESDGKYRASAVTVRWLAANGQINKIT